MKLKFSSHFLFTVCQLGAESALKKEVARDYPHFKFAYSCPGFLTFKQEMGEELPFDFIFQSVFSRAYGISLGKLSWNEAGELSEWAREWAQQFPKKSLRLHLWERDFHSPGEEPLGFIRGCLAEQLRQKFSSFLLDSSVAEIGDPVLDLIVLGPDELWVGAHIHSGQHSRWPGGQTPIELPLEAPSRAYLKLEESLLWSGAPLRAGDTAVEIGSAPGGASFGLLKRGLRVVGIDPAQMDPWILKNPLFHHHQQTVNSVLRESLPESVQWVLLDMNVEPRICLFSVERLVSRMKDSLLGVFLTLKLNQWKIAEDIPEILDHVRAMGMSRLKTAQLYHHRQEIIVYGLTRKGLARK